jgi:hypothetical protein
VGDRRRGDDGRHLLCYGGSAGARTVGAVDGPGVRRAHGAVRRRGRRGSRRLGQGERRGAWISGSSYLGRRVASGGARAIWGFSSQILKYTTANFECQPVSWNSRPCLCNQFFPLKI